MKITDFFDLFWDGYTYALPSDGCSNIGLAPFNTFIKFNIKQQDGTTVMPMFISAEQAFMYYNYDNIIINISPSDDSMFAIPRYTNSSQALRNFIYTKKRLLCMRLVNSVYYGRNGLILDSKLNPLMICASLVSLETSNVNYTQPICMISNRVFSSDNILEKTIRIKGIPYYANNKVRVSDHHSFYGTKELPVKIVIMNLDDFVLRPAIPDISVTDNENVRNNILRGLETMDYE